MLLSGSDLARSIKVSMVRLQHSLNSISVSWVICKINTFLKITLLHPLKNPLKNYLQIKQSLDLECNEWYPTKWASNQSSMFCKKQLTILYFQIRLLV